MYGPCQFTLLCVVLGHCMEGEENMKSLRSNNPTVRDIRPPLRSCRCVCFFFHASVGDRLLPKDPNWVTLSNSDLGLVV